MHEHEIKAIVEAVMGVLAEKGLLGQGPGATGKGSEKPGGVRVTTGTAGKVFSEEWSRMGGNAAHVKPPAAACGSKGPDSPCACCGSACSRRPASSPAGEGDHTHSPDCPHCNPLAKYSRGQLKDIGADRIGVCHPTKSCNEISSYVDHTLLKPVATQEEIAKLCEEARAYCFASVCVNPSYVSLSAKLLKGSGVKVCTVVGFPLGSTTPTVKAIEARDAMANGADEIDMVINVGALKSGNDALVRDDIQAVRDATRGKVLKVILETSLLTRDEKIRACRISKEVGADFVKTSTGFGPGGATVEDVRLMRETVGPMMGVKASGGIRDTAMAQQMIEAGATRLGTSASVGIVTHAPPEQPKGSKPQAY